MLTARIAPGASDGLKRRLGEYAKLHGTVQMGFFPGATYPNGKSIALVAYYNEYGGRHTPRPFMKNTAKAQGKKWARGFKNNAMQGGKLTQAGVDRALNMVGQVGVGDIKRTIQTWDPSDRNDPKTVARKAARMTNANPEAILIDTTRMISNVKFEVTDK